MSPAEWQDTMRRVLGEIWAGRSAHVDLEAALSNLDPSLRGVRPEGLPHSVWELVEHLRRAQRDLVDYTVAASYDELGWPDAYWPEPRERVDDATWDASLAGLRDGLRAMESWLNDPAFDLCADIARSDLLPDGGRRTPLRQLLVAVDHLAYHLGQIVQVRRALDAW